MSKWIDNREQEPTQNGTYLTQMINGGLMGLGYTREGGWNTFIASDGELCNKHAMDTREIARWLDAPEPPEVSDEWFLDAMKKMRG